MANIDLHDRLAVVTGASSGLGEQTAIRLAVAGAQVVLAVRNPEKAELTKAAILLQAPRSRVEIAELELGRLSSVAGFVEAHADRTVDILVNNAGTVAGDERSFTEDGFETHMGVNHLGHYALTHGLLPALLRSPIARVVSVSSIAARLTGPFDPGMGETGSYAPFDSYGQSKLACAIFGFELDRRAKRAGVALTSVVAHPGWSSTNLFPSEPDPPLYSRITQAMARRIASPATDGVMSQLRAATDAELTGGELIGPRWLTHGRPHRETPKPTMTDPHAATRLWASSESRTGLRIDLGR